MKTFIKWAGGKEKELPIIMANLPKYYNRYIEPFVGGGAVYLNINCDGSIINDKSSELILLYRMIKSKNTEFIKSLNDINRNWIKLENIVMDNSFELINIYLNYKKEQSDIEKVVDTFLNKHKKSFDILLRDDVDINLYNLYSEMKKNLISKITRMYKIEKTRKEMQAAAKQLDFITAAQLRDHMFALMAKLDTPLA